MSINVYVRAYMLNLLIIIINSTEETCTDPCAHALTDYNQRVEAKQRSEATYISISAAIIHDTVHAA